MDENPVETGQQMVKRWRKGTGGDFLSAPVPNDADRAFIKCAYDFESFLSRLRELSAKMAEFDEKYPGPYDRGIPGNIHPIEVLRDDLETLLGERVTGGEKGQ